MISDRLDNTNVRTQNNSLGDRTAEAINSFGFLKADLDLP